MLEPLITISEDQTLILLLLLSKPVIGFQNINSKYYIAVAKLCNAVANELVNKF